MRNGSFGFRFAFSFSLLTVADSGAGFATLTSKSDFGFAGLEQVLGKWVLDWIQKQKWKK